MRPQKRRVRQGGETGKGGTGTIGSMKTVRHHRRRWRTEMREVIEFLETKEIEACGTPAYKDPAARALKAGVLIVWDPDHLQAKRDGKGEVVIEDVERGRIVRVEMEERARHTTRVTRSSSS